MLSEKLKEGTKVNHQLLEKKLINRMRAIHDKHDYADLLTLFYSFFGGLEIGIKKYFDQSNLPDYNQRRKTSNLVDDLVYLNEKLPLLAQINELPEIINHFQALGALYVIEGSTLGGRIISKMLYDQLNIHDFGGMSFFNGYGNDTVKMWETFKLSLDLPIYSTEQEVIIRSANDTFQQFGLWFDKKSL